MTSKHGPIQKVDKVWGFEEWWVNEPEYCFKILVIKPGTTSSIHYHNQKKETFLVLKGRCFLDLWDSPNADEVNRYNLEPEDQVVIKPGIRHRFMLEYSAEQPCIIYEISSHHDEADVVRITKSGRLTGNISL
jgi:mannose-6-phosphate isomerase-like protein (cupin superfamily)